MRILAIDTSTSSLGAAIADENGVLGEFGLHTGRQHSEALLPLLDGLLRAAGLKLAELDAFAVTVGPGSFTGLRIGLATVKAWVQALNKPLCAVSTLEALAYTAFEADKLICPVLDARRNEVYAALFADGKRLTQDMAITPALLAEKLLLCEQPILFTGDGLAAASPALRQTLGEKMLVTTAPRRLFLAATAAVLGLKQAQAGQFVDAAHLTPQYLRLSEPEEKMRARLAGEYTGAAYEV